VNVYEFVQREKAHHAVVRLCHVLGVSPSGYWAWRKRAPSAHFRADEQLAEQIHAIHQASRGTYGAPRVHMELMTTHRDPAAKPAPDLVQRAFAAQAPNQLWIADITYVPTWEEGFLYLAVILDVFSRRVVGWSMAAHLRTDLVLAALNMALQHRRPAAGVIHHSDHGSQYTAAAFQERCRRAGVRSSMGSVGDSSENRLKITRQVSEEGTPHSTRRREW